MRDIILVLALAAAAPLLAQSPSYRITHTYTLGGDGSWDYIVPDPASHRQAYVDYLNGRLDASS